MEDGKVKRAVRKTDRKLRGGSWFSRIRPDHPEYDPELAKKHYLMIQANGRKGKRGGIPKSQGWTGKTWYPYMEGLMADAKKIVDGMDEKDLLDLRTDIDITDKDAAKEAMSLNVAVVRNPYLAVKDRLAAAKTVLDFTKTKPVTKNETVLKTAEDFLAELADEAGIV